MLLIPNGLLVLARQVEITKPGVPCLVAGAIRHEVRGSRINIILAGPGDDTDLCARWWAGVTLWIRRPWLRRTRWTLRGDPSGTSDI
jgi:hypothetical protein